MVWSLLVGAVSALTPYAAALMFPGLFLLFALYIPLPSEITDYYKLSIVEPLLRITGEYMAEAIELFLGPEWRNYFVRIVMGLSFYLPVPKPADIEYSWITLRNVPVRLIRPKETKNRKETGIVYIHGGGWATMRPQAYDHALAYIVKKLGCTIFAVDYRLAPEHPYPAAVEDCEAATVDAYKRRKEFGLGDTKLVLMGDSAGGNLSAVLSRRLREKKMIQCQVLIYPVTTVFAFSMKSYKEYFSKCAGTALLNPFSMARWILFYAGLDACSTNVNKLIASAHIPRRTSKILDEVLDKYEQPDVKTFPDEKLLKQISAFGLDPDVSPLLAPDLSGLPPTMVITAGIDVLRDEGIAYAERLNAAGVQVDHKHYPSAYHGILNMPYSRVRKQMKRDILAFLDTHASRTH